MHDLNGRPITPGCKVRMATKEELEAKGLQDTPVSMSPAEQFAFPSGSGEGCNVTCVPEVYTPWPSYDANGFALLEVKARGTASTQTARMLVRVD